MRRHFCITSACEILGYSRQAYYKPVANNKMEDTANLLFQILPDVVTSRKKRPTKGCRCIYQEFAHKWPIGRDRIVSLLIDSGYGVRFPKRYHKATQSGNREFPNLLVNKKIDDINQVWQSDMAHYMVGDQRFYTIYITDVYSQEIVGHGAFITNQAANYNAVLLQAISSQVEILMGLIHHSDGGKQYESMIYKATCSRFGIQQSMCMFSFENPYAEKTNDLINNGYLNSWKPTTLTELRRKQSQAVRDHNLYSKKRRLGGKSPIEFKQWIKENKNNANPILELKPSNPEQPKNKTLHLN